MILSTPVCGVEIKNDSVAPLVAPLLYIEVATGITPHEQSGIGTPKIEAFKMDIIPGLPTFFVIISLEVTIYNSPDIKNPRIR
jgi:hypothetical protein